MKKVEVVAAIIEHEGYILCCQRQSSKFTYLSEKWEFPGGKLEPGETQEKALHREIYEELEMKIYDLKFALTVKHKYPDFRLTMHTFFAKTNYTNYKLNAHQNAVWFSVDEFHKLDWAKADLPIVEYIKN